MRIRKFLIVVVVCFAAATTAWSQAQAVNLIIGGARIAKSADARARGKALDHKRKILGDSLGYATYYIYRNGSPVGSALSMLVYDNDEYVATSNIRTFVKVDSVIAGDHYFSSKENAKTKVKVYLERGKTYIIRTYAAMRVDEDTLIVMDEEMIRKEIRKGNFFAQKFPEIGLKPEEICTRRRRASKEL